MSELSPITILLAVVLTVLTGCAVRSGIQHTVREGQTLWRISRAYDVDLELLLRVNDIENAREVPVGMKLLIPGAARHRKVSVQPSTRKRVSNSTSDVKSGRNSTRSRKSEKSNKSERIKPQEITDRSDRSPGATDSFHPVWPCKGRIVSRFDKNGDPTKQGIMMRVSPNTEVKAIESGNVRIAGEVDEPEELTQFGKLVMIFHNDNFVSVYAHLDTIDVSKGDSVRRGEVLGKAGVTGYVERRSCYLQIRYKLEPRDPLFFLGDPA